MRIVFLGPPGAGKGTQAQMLAEHLSIPHISTGEMLRAAVQGGSELGQRVKSYLDSGELVPDEVIIDVIEARLTEADCSHGFLLDGFPRTEPQAAALSAMLKRLSMDLTHVVELEVPEDELIERIRNRGAQGSGRSDDTVEVAKKRLEVYRAQTEPVTTYYETHGGVSKVDGVGDIDQVRQRVLTAVEAK